jgi:hypothetical protein
MEPLLTHGLRGLIELVSEPSKQLGCVPGLMVKS